MLHLCDRMFKSVLILSCLRFLFKGLVLVMNTFELVLLVFHINCSSNHID